MRDNNSINYSDSAKRNRHMQNQIFTLATELQDDSYYIADLALSQLLLFNNVNFPSLILVPKVNNVVEIFELKPELQHQLIDEITAISKMLKKLYSCDKVNIAAIGNKVAQLHIHVVARFKTDSVWPHPVWGLPTKPYLENRAKEFINKIQNELPKYLSSVN